MVYFKSGPKPITLTVSQNSNIQGMLRMITVPVACALDQIAKVAKKKGRFSSSFSLKVELSAKTIL